MVNVLDGWLGYGTAFIGGMLIEPTDIAYARSSISFAFRDRGVLSDIGPGTVGPAGTAWGLVAYTGVFDAPVNGNLLFWTTMMRPATVRPGATLSTSPGAMNLLVPELVGNGGVRTWPTGAQMGTTSDGRPVFIATPMQWTGGILCAQAPAFGTNVVMANLPQSQAVSGSGQLWNNGGVISVS